jgi:hypothetical protein
MIFVAIVSPDQLVSPDQQRFIMGHQWVGAALVGMGRGHSSRAEHAARTGRHVMRAATRIEVLEVYCGTCRVRYDDRQAFAPCTGAVAARIA